LACAIDPVALSARPNVNLCRWSVGIFRAYDDVDFPIMVRSVRPEKQSRRAENLGSTAMDTNTLLIIVVVIFLFGGFGFYGRGRWF